MKNQFIKLTAIALFATIIIFSCKKKDTTTPEEPASTTAATTTTGGTTGTQAVNGFTWTETYAGLSATNTADSAYWTTGTWGTGIRAFKAGLANFFEINWATQNNTSVGNKTLTTNYDFTFLKGTDTYSISANQTLSVTAFTNNQLSGGFNVPVSGGSCSAISATFASLPKKQ